MSTSQKLAVILFADIEGYTAMMQQDQETALQLLNRFKLVLEAETAQNQGTVIQYFGDGALLTFESAASAVTCAMTMQSAYQVEPLVPVRMGIHLGDVLFKEGNIFGDGVNVASRIESLSVPGAVLMSKAIRDQLKNKAGFQTSSLGNFEFKNVVEPVEVFALANEGFVVPKRGQMKGKLKEKKQHPFTKTWVLATVIALLVALAWNFWPSSSIPSNSTESTAINQAQKSIAVLPFKDMSEKGDQEYFGDGVAEEILNTLAQVEGLKVIGRTSSFSFKNKELSIQEIGQRLNVSTVLEGSIKKEGDRLRINTHLINATNEESIWVETYDRKINDIFAIQSEIARRTAQKMKVSLMTDGKESLNFTRTNNQKAYDAYLKGIYATQRDLDNKQASAYFLDAIRLDPSFVDAYNGLGITHTLDVYSGLIEPKIAFSQAFQLLELAKNIDPNTEETFTTWHDINLWYQWDWDKMQADIERDRFKDSPYLYDRFYAHALFYSMQGQFEKAIQNIEIAFEYEPLRVSCRIDHITLLFAARQFEKGGKLIHTYIQQFPQKGFHYKLARLHFWKGEYSQALAIFEAAENVHHDLSAFDTFIDKALIISSLAKLGRKSEAQDLLTQLHEKQKSSYVDPLTFALPYYYLNEKEKALSYLESAFYQRSYWFSYAKTHPFYDPFRKEPRFESILKSMKFLE